MASNSTTIHRANGEPVTLKRKAPPAFHRNEPEFEANIPFPYRSGHLDEQMKKKVRIANQKEKIKEMQKKVELEESTLKPQYEPTSLGWCPTESTFKNTSQTYTPTSPTYTPT